MSLVQHITVDVGGTVSVQPMDRPSNALVTIYDDQGAILVNNQVAVISSLNTVLTNAVNARAKVIAVSNGAQFSEGDVFVISSPKEWHRCKTVTGNQVSIWQPLREAHANNATVYSTLCTYAVNAASANYAFFDGRARWELDTDIKFTGVECTLYPLKRTATEQDIYAINSDFAALMSSTEDPETALDAAHEFVLEQLGAKGRARVFPASQEFNRAVALAFARNHYLGQSTEVAERKCKQYSEELTEAIALLLESLSPDDNQDGVISGEEKRSQGTFHLERG